MLRFGHSPMYQHSIASFRDTPRTLSSENNLQIVELRHHTCISRLCGITLDQRLPDSSFALVVIHFNAVHLKSNCKMSGALAMKTILITEQRIKLIDLNVSRKAR